MGIFDELKHKAEELGDKAGDLLGDAREKAGDLVDDVRERLGDHGGDHAPTSESEDVGPDSSATDAVDPGYVTGEDAADEEIAAGDDGDTELDTELDGEVDGALDSDLGSSESDADPDGLVLDAPATTEAFEPETGADTQADVSVEEEPLEPVVTEIDPSDQPLSESIGAEIGDVDREALARAVESSGTDPETDTAER